MMQDEDAEGKLIFNTCFYLLFFSRGAERIAQSGAGIFFEIPGFTCFLK
jgi:hypothetical protein